MTIHQWDNTLVRCIMLKYFLIMNYQFFFPESATCPRSSLMLLHHGVLPNIAFD